MTAPDTQPAQQPSGSTRFVADAEMRSHRFGNLLRSETFGGVLLLIATVLALIAANAPALRELYEGVRETYLGFSLGSAESPWLDLELSIGHWAADGLLAVFFFMVGLELKREFTTGDLRDPGKALVPVAAAAGGVIVPALIFVGVVSLGGGEALGGWAVPTATDIAFATAVLAIVGTHLPLAMRTFLLTLAVVDDLIAITIIAIFYTSDLSLVHLGAALIPLALFALVAYKGQEVFAAKAWTAWAVLLPLGLITWALFYNSGVHATIAGVILAFLIPVRPPRGGAMASSGLGMGLAEHLEHRVRPLSAVICVPVFAFFSAGVFVGGWSGLTEAWTSATALGVILGLVVGKTIGITGTTFLVTRLRRVNLDPEVQWIDVVGLASLAGIGFTVSLLISELSFGQGSELDATAKVGILTGSVLAAILGGGLLSLRNRHYRNLEAKPAGADDAATDEQRA